MGIFSRLSDIINSNLTSILDRAEDPEKMIRLMIHEMEDTLVEVRADAARIIADKKDAERTLGKLETAAEEWQSKAELAVAKGREDLAKGALLEKSKLEETSALLTDDLAALNAALAKHEDDIVKLESKLNEAKAKQKSLKARHETASSQIRVRRQVNDKRIQEAFARFELMERRMDTIEGEVESFDLGKTKTLAEEIAELEAESGIERELQALKARMSGRKTETQGN